MNLRLSHCLFALFLPCLWAVANECDASLASHTYAEDSTLADSLYTAVSNRDTMNPYVQESLDVLTYNDSRMSGTRSQKLDGKPVLFAIETNLLMDASLTPHLGVEAQFCGRWSLCAEGWWSGWSSARNHKYWRMAGAAAELRFWFGKESRKNALSGHHIGVFGMGFYYDIMLGKYGYQTPDNRFAVGINYGYSLPVAKRLNIDFSLGIGYSSGRRLKYEEMCGRYIAVWRKNSTWIGPVKAGVTLVWRIGPDHCNCNINTIAD